MTETVERKHPLALCEKCGLLDRPYIPSEFPVNSVKISLVLEAGGREEAVQKRPLVGTSGKLVFNLIKQIDITREDCLIANSVNCFPPQRSQGHKPTSAEIRNCNPRLINELVQEGADVIVCMGASAYEALTGEVTAITSIRGQPFQLELTSTEGVTREFTVLQGSALNDLVSDLNQLEDLLSGEKTPEHILPTEYVIDTVKQMREYIDKVRAAPKPIEIACDIETGGFDYFGDQMLCVSFSSNGQIGVVVSEEMCRDHREFLLELFKIEGITWTYHNGKFDTQFLTSWINYEIPENDDTMLKSYALDVRRGQHSLKVQARVRLGAPNYEAEVKKYLPNKRTSYAVIPRPVLYKYGAYDVAYTRRLSPVYDGQMSEGQKNFYRNVLMPASRAFRHAEREGMPIDMELIEHIRRRFKPMLGALTQEMYESTGEEFNPNSPQQIAQVMFGKLKLPRVRGNSTDKEVLEVLEGKHPLIKQLESYRKLNKFYGTYVEGIADDIWYDGRVRPTYLIHGAISRTSCIKPPIQTIPRKPHEAPDEYSRELGGLIKKEFVAPPGWSMGQIDLSQHEFRCIAHISGDEWLSEQFRLGKDLHAETSTIPGMPKIRFEAKMVNFGILYQRGAYSLGLQMERPESEAQAYINAWNARMPKVKEKSKEWQNMAIKGETFRNLLGREYNFGLVTYANQKAVLKQCTNWEPQSTGNDTALMAMAEVDRLISMDRLRIVGFIHDAIIFFWKDETALDEAAQIMADVPPAALKSDVVWEVEVAVGPNWGELEEIARWRSGGVKVS